MTFEIILDVAIGLTLVFVLTSILASSINEIVAALMNRRGRLLEQAMYQMLDGQKPKRHPIAHLISRSPVIESLKLDAATSNADEFFRDPIIKTMRSTGRLPSFLEPELAGSVISRVAKNAKLNTSTDSSASPLSELFVALDDLNPDEHASESALAAALYKYQMDRVTGWYKRRTQISLFFIGFLLALVINIDAIKIASSLASNANLRDQTAIAAQAYQASAQSPILNGDAADARSNFNNAYEELTSLTIPIGRPGLFEGSSTETKDQPDEETAILLEKARTCFSNQAPQTEIERMHAGIPVPMNSECLKPEIFELYPAVTSAELPARTENQNTKPEEPQPVTVVNLFGWLLTGLAAALGAPFWFDLLGRLVNSRGTGEKPKPAEVKITTGTSNGKSGLEILPIKPQESPTTAAPNFMARTAYEQGLTNEDYIDIGLSLGIGDVSGRSVLADPSFREAIKQEQLRRGLAATGELSEEFVTSLFSG